MVNEEEIILAGGSKVSKSLGMESPCPDQR